MDCRCKSHERKLKSCSTIGQFWKVIMIASILFLFLYCLYLEATAQQNRSMSAPTSEFSSIVRLLSIISLLGVKVGLAQGFSTFIPSFAPWQISKVKFTPKFFMYFLFYECLCWQNLPPVKNPWPSQKI